MPQQIINGVGRIGFRSAAPPPSYDADALAYFNANTAITSTADKDAINTFFLGLKTDGIYTKIKAMYLPIWGSAATCKWNLVNPLDTNEAFRLTFHGTSWDFTSRGMKPTIAYANTYFVQTSSLVSVNSVHLSVYVRENSDNSGVDIGVTWSQSGRDQFSLIKSKDYNPGTGLLDRATFEINNNNIGFYNATSTDSRGFFIGTRTGVSTVKGFKNANLIYNSTRNATFLAPYPIYIGANSNNGSVNIYSAKRNSFSSIGTGLTDAEANNFYSRVQTLMTYFNINV